MAAAPHTCSSACQCANQNPPLHIHTHTHCGPTSPSMVRVSSTLKNPAFVPAALKKSVLMISFYSLFPSGCVFRSLHFLSFSLCHSHPFCPHWKDSVNYLHHPPPLSVCLPACLCLSLSHPSFIYWTDPADRLIYSLGSTQCLKCLNTAGCCEGEQGLVGGGEWIHDTHSIPLQVSNSQYTLGYNRNTRVIYPPCFITSWLTLIYTPTVLATSQQFF